MPKRPKMDIASVLAPERDTARSRQRASKQTRSQNNTQITEILHVYMPAELKDRFRKLQAQLQLERGETWKLSDIARAVLTIGLDAGEDAIVDVLDDVAVS